MSCAGETYTTSDISLSENSLLIAQKRNLIIDTELEGEGVSVELSYTPGNIEAEGWVDYVRVQAVQELQFYGGQFHVNGTHYTYDAESAEYVLGSASTVDEVWDVTDHLDPRKVDVEGLGSGEISWKALRDKTRRFVAFRL